MTAGPEYCNIREAQDKDHKIAFKNVTEVLKGAMNKSLEELYENTNSGREWIKQFKTWTWKEKQYRKSKLREIWNRKM